MFVCPTRCSLLCADLRHRLDFLEFYRCAGAETPTGSHSLHTAILTFSLRAFVGHLRADTTGLLLRFAHAHAPCPWPPLTPTARAGTELTYCALSLTAKLYLGWCDARPFLCHDAFSKPRFPLQVRAPQRRHRLARRGRRRGRAPGLEQRRASELRRARRRSVKTLCVRAAVVCNSMYPFQAPTK